MSWGVVDVLRLLEEIPNKTQAMLGIMVDVNLKMESGREYLQIVVAPHPNPVSYKGAFHYRSGSTKQVLKGAALTRFLLERHGRTWDDVPIPDIGIGELDDHALKGFRRLASASGRLPANISDASNSSIIEKLNLRDGASLKRAAVLFFHPAPERFVIGSCVKIGAFQDSELLYQDLVEGNLFVQVERTMELLYTKYSKALISYDGLYRVETFPVPREAMREAVINAIIHREFSSAAPIQIRVYDNRISIWNPGQLPAGWSVDQLQEEHSSRPRNPNIAYTFFRAGMIEAWGLGIRKIVDVCKREGIPTPQWKLEPGGGLWLEFRYSKEYRKMLESQISSPNGENQDASQDASRGSTEASQHRASEFHGRENAPKNQGNESEKCVAPAIIALVSACQDESTRQELQSAMKLKSRKNFHDRHLKPAMDQGYIVRTLSDKPTSRLQRYRLTRKGKALLKRSQK